MMVMDEGQIVREYRAAKHKRHEITVLAQLNCCRESEILRVLEEGGVPPKEMPRKKRKPEPETMDAAPEAMDAAPDLYTMIGDMIREAEAAREAAVRQLEAAEERLRVISAQLMELAKMAGGGREDV